MKLMIIDDHAGVRNLIRELVAAPSDAVCECADGSEAVRIARFFKPDFVTMDVRMPGLCGFEATRAIREAVPESRVVVVTAFDQPEFRRTAFAVGASGFVLKENLGELRAVLFDSVHVTRKEC
jgi:DNA-binding NarL/FixJ family response regulator